MEQQIACFVVPLLVIVGWMYDHVLHLGRLAHFFLSRVGQPLTLHFHNFEVCLFRTYSARSYKYLTNFQTIVLFVSVFLVNLLIMLVSLIHVSPIETKLTCFRDGRSNYMEGLMLLTLYLVIAIACESRLEPFDRILIVL